MAFEGDLKDLSLGDICQKISENRLTGTLCLAFEGHERARVHFVEGKIALFSPDETPGPPFVDVLRRLEAVPEPELALAEKKRGRKGLKTVLEERKLLTPEGYKAAAERYLVDAVSDLFISPRGRFRFEEGEAPKGAFDSDLKSAKAAVEPNSILLEGLRRQDEWTRISRQIRSFADVFTPTRAPEPEEVESLSAEARKLLALLHGCRSLQECIAEMPCGRFATGAALIELLAQNLVEPATADLLGARAHEVEKAGDLDEAERLYRRALEVERNNLALRESLAELLERLGRAEDAGRERTLLGLGRAGERDLAGAIAEYKHAADLQPTDTAALERVLELERSRRDQGAVLAAGKRLAERYGLLKLNGRARDLYRDLIREFPDDLDLQARLAETLGSLGDTRQAAGAWRGIAKRREKEGDDGAALFAYQRALDADPGDSEAKQRSELIRSGRLEKRRRQFRRARLVAAAALLAVLVSFLISREISAFSLLHAWCARALYPVSAGDGGALAEGFTSVSKAYPFTIASLKARAFAEAALDGELARVEMLRLDRSYDVAQLRVARLAALDLPPDLRRKVEAARARLEAEAPRPVAGAPVPPGPARQ